MSAINFATSTFAAYRRFIAAEPEKFQTENALGGLLFFAGSLAERTRPFLVAANISGAASLVIADDAEQGKQALRDGVVDFLVSSLDEALRILKNDLRKKQPTAVAVAAPYADVLTEMIDRGVQPDLVDDEVVSFEQFLLLGARILPDVKNISPQSLILVHASAVQLASVDSFVRELMQDVDSPTARWFRLSARYLGRLAQGMRAYSFESENAQTRVAQLCEFIQENLIEATVEIAQ